MTLAEKIAAHRPAGFGRFTLERTAPVGAYSAKIGLFAHGRYQKNSVRAGEPRKVWVDDFDSVAEARAALEALPPDLRRLVRDHT